MIKNTYWHGRRLELCVHKSHPVLVIPSRMYNTGCDSGTQRLFLYTNCATVTQIKSVDGYPSKDDVSDHIGMVKDFKQEHS